MLSNHYYLGISCSEACSAWERAKLQAPRGQHNHSLNSCTIYCKRQFILTSHRDRSNFVGGPWRAASSFLPAPVWPQILNQITHIWPAMCVGPCWIGALGWFLPLSPNDIWIVARVKQIKVQNLHSSHSEAVHIYTAPPCLWLGCFLGRWKFELMKTERGTEPPIQFSASRTRAVILEYYQKTGRAGRCCLCFQVLVLGNCVCERMRGMHRWA